MSMGRTSLFVGDLAIFCTEMDLERIFSAYGQVLEIKIMRSEETYRNLSYGFIKFALFECARQAMLELDGVLLCGRPMRVRWATFKNKLNPKDSKADGLETSPVHVSFISYQISRLVTEQTLRALFGRFGEVVDVSIKKSMIDKDIDRQSGYGFVHYSIQPDGVQAAVMAAQYLHDTTIDDVNYKSSISHNLNRFLVEDMGIPQSTLPPPAPSIFTSLNNPPPGHAHAHAHANHHGHHNHHSHNHHGGHHAPPSPSAAAAGGAAPPYHLPSDPYQHVPPVSTYHQASPTHHSLAHSPHNHHLAAGPNGYHGAPRPGGGYKAHGAPISTSYYPQHHMYVTNHYDPVPPPKPQSSPPYAQAAAYGAARHAADPAAAAYYPPASSAYPAAGYGAPPAVGAPYEAEHTSPTAAVAYQYQSAVAAVTGGHTSSPTSGSPTASLTVAPANHNQYHFGGLTVEPPAQDYHHADAYAMADYGAPYDATGYPGVGAGTGGVDETLSALQGLDLNALPLPLPPVSVVGTTTTTTSSSSISGPAPAPALDHSTATTSNNTTNTTGADLVGTGNHLTGNSVGMVGGVGYFNSPIVSLQSPMSDLVREEQLTFVNHLLHSPATTSSAVPVPLNTTNATNNNGYFLPNGIAATADPTTTATTTTAATSSNTSSSSIRSLSNPFRNKLHFTDEGASTGQDHEHLSLPSLSSELDSATSAVETQ